MTIKQKSCFNCRHLRKYTSEDRSWMDVCEAEQPEEIEEGMFYVTTIDAERYTPSGCILFRKNKE